MRALPFAAVLLAGCATTSAPVAVEAPMVAATAETDPVDTAADAADDPAIWRNASDPAKSLVIGTDKKAGIHVYSLTGKRLSFTPAARLNNVDLRDLGGRVIAAASDRADVNTAHVSLFTLDTAAAKLVPLGRFSVGPGEAYGMCLWTRARPRAVRLRRAQGRPHRPGRDRPVGCVAEGDHGPIDEARHPVRRLRRR
ncbi:phytase [Sphingomonas sp. LR55]|uniref:phytase n=1 Tax=Sphingomonas sp. LR55 TaxID=3050231 RepID=UPI002FE16AE0